MPTKYQPYTFSHSEIPSIPSNASYCAPQQTPLPFTSNIHATCEYKHHQRPCTRLADTHIQRGPRPTAPPPPAGVCDITSHYLSTFSHPLPLRSASSTSQRSSNTPASTSPTSFPFWRQTCLLCAPPALQWGPLPAAQMTRCHTTSASLERCRMARVRSASTVTNTQSCKCYWGYWLMKCV